MLTYNKITYLYYLFCALLIKLNNFSNFLKIVLNIIYIFLVVFLRIQILKQKIEFKIS